MTTTNRNKILSSEQYSAYLKKLGIEAEQPSAEFLRKLQKSHMQTIPFENLDAMAEKEASTDIDVLFEKIVSGTRGGLGIELNTLFNALLQTAGFETQSYAARFVSENDEKIQSCLHRICAVKLENKKYLADVGMNREAPRSSLVIETGTEQSDGVSLYKFEKNSFGETLLLQKTGFMPYTPLYAFREVDLRNEEFKPALTFACLSRESTVNKSNKISIFTRDSFVCVISDMMKTIKNGRIAKTVHIEDRKQMNNILKDIFGIEIKTKIVCDEDDAEAFKVKEEK